MTMFDKLGDLLSEALDSGTIPQNKNSVGQDGNEPCDKESESVHATSSAVRIPVPPEKVKTALRILGITADCTYEEAHRKYREKLMHFHPDKNNSNTVVQKVAKEKTASFISAWKDAGEWFKKNR